MSLLQTRNVKAWFTWGNHRSKA